MHKARLCLGTVQLGMKYGVNNAIGRQPTKEESFALLQASQNAGIDTFDTASVYGNAEEILGLFHQKTHGDVRFISKLKPECDDNPITVLEEIRGSLQRLKVKQLAGYLLHRATDIKRQGIMEGLTEAKKDGLTEKIGVSIYEPEEAMLAAGDKRIDCIQVPYNVLDKRLDKAGFFELAKSNHIEIYARSALLQGLLLMEPQKAEQRVNGSGKFIAKFQQIAKEFNYTPVEAAFLYCVNHPGIDYVVFGVDTVEQLAANINIYNKLEGFEACFNELSKHFEQVSKKIIMPNLW